MATEKRDVCRSLNADEERARRYLEERYPEASIVFEPDGRSTPDFVVDARIAVEVRRLDKAVETPNGLRFVDEDSTPLMLGMRRLLDSLRFPDEPGRWRVHVGLGPQHGARWGQLKWQVRYTIQSFLADKRPWPFSYRVTPSLRLSFIPMSRKKGPTFEFLGLTDSRAAGFVTPDLFDNLRRCIAEKAKKIEKVRHRYEVWWLVLVDHLHGYIPDDFSVDEFWRSYAAPHPFAQVTVLSAWGEDWAFHLREP